jgi:hypothetical protein
MLKTSLDQLLFNHAIFVLLTKMSFAKWKQRTFCCLTKQALHFLLSTLSETKKNLCKRGTISITHTTSIAHSSYQKVSMSSLVSPSCSVQMRPFPTPMLGPVRIVFPLSIKLQLLATGWEGWSTGNGCGRGEDVIHSWSSLFATALTS